MITHINNTQMMSWSLAVLCWELLVITCRELYLNYIMSNEECQSRSQYNIQALQCWRNYSKNDVLKSRCE